MFDNFFDYIKENFYDLVCYHGLVLNYSIDGYYHVIDAPYKKSDYGDFIETLPGDNKYYDNNEYAYNSRYYKANTAPKIENNRTSNYYYRDVSNIMNDNDLMVDRIGQNKIL